MASPWGCSHLADVLTHSCEVHVNRQPESPPQPGARTPPQVLPMWPGLPHGVAAGASRGCVALWQLSPGKPPGVPSAALCWLRQSVLLGLRERGPYTSWGGGDGTARP